MSVSGRKYLSKGRPKGSAPWRPQKKSLERLKQVRAVLATYSFAITIRQVFYRMVGLGQLPKTESAYTSLLYLIGRARRAGMIKWEEIADDSLNTYGPTVHEGGVKGFMEWAKGQAQDHLFCDWSEGQKVHKYVWVESDGMAASLRAGLATRHWPNDVVTTSGSDSVKPKYDMAVQAVERFKNTGQITKVGHVGDLDEAGVSILDALAADLAAFVADMGAAGCLEVEFVALTPGQVSLYGLPTTPGKDPKPTKDGRLWVPPGGTMALSVQAEALDPADLLDEVDDWLREDLDLDVLNERLAKSQGLRNGTMNLLTSMIDTLAEIEEGESS